ncbi:MAG TPA: hypothetical protein PLU81_11095 [Deltaproteobacteria bacterium]|nr:hypothetical protein [Deltaproteobacteria bacterium]HPJ94769.1 hypothetical protein [Deltaproteobacteria bacterium]HPR52325.1 hypothetical protein [Deltaproteobacteria bacterium]
MKMVFDELNSTTASRRECESPEVQRLIEQRNRFLADHPYLQSTQDEIDKLMGSTLDPMVRLEILFMLMSGKLSELRNVFEELMRLAKSLPDS